MGARQRERAGSGRSPGHGDRMVERHDGCDAARRRAAQRGARPHPLRAAARGRARALILSNPRWARPFELFPGALGVPGSTEADPTVLLAIVVPASLRLHVRRRGTGTAPRRRGLVAARSHAGGAIADGGRRRGHRVRLRLRQRLRDPRRGRRTLDRSARRARHRARRAHRRGRGAARGGARAACAWGRCGAASARASTARTSDSSRSTSASSRRRSCPGLHWLAIAGAAAFVAGHAIHAGQALRAGRGARRAARAHAAAPHQHACPSRAWAPSRSRTRASLPPSRHSPCSPTTSPFACSSSCSATPS